MIIGLGIRYVGSVAAAALAAHFGSLDAIMAASQEELRAIDGIGPVVAASVVDFFSREEERRVVEKLAPRGCD